jgi:DNA-binding FrmR family transcriptional regulator
LVSHTTRDKVKLMGRVKRIRGQVDALSRAIDTGVECMDVLQQIAACRGAVDGLMAEVLEGHIREHLIDSKREPTRAEVASLEELVQLIKRYLK